jgi:hypothetical protein
VRFHGSGGEPCLRLLGDVSGMIVEDQADGGVGWIGGVNELEKLDELAAAMAVLDQGMDVAGDEIDPGQQADRAVALVLNSRVKAGRTPGSGEQVWDGRCDRLNAGLLVIGDDCRRFARLLVFLRACRRGLLQDFHLAVDARHLRHLGLELAVPAFQVVPHFVRLDLLRSRILHTVPCASRLRQAYPSAGPCLRTWPARSRVVHISCG